MIYREVDCPLFSRILLFFGADSIYDHCFLPKCVRHSRMVSAVSMVVKNPIFPVHFCFFSVKLFFDNSKYNFPHYRCLLPCINPFELSNIRKYHEKSDFQLEKTGNILEKIGKILGVKLKDEEKMWKNTGKNRNFGGGVPQI